MALQLVLVNHWAGFPRPNERGRAFQALAVMTQGTLRDRPTTRALRGLEDVACPDGRSYPTKALGLLLLGVPAAWLARLSGCAESPAGLRWTLFGGRLLASLLSFVDIVLVLVRLAVGADRLAGVLGVACVAAAISLALRQTLPATWQARLEGAVVHDVYAGGHAESLETLRAAARTPEQRAQVEAWIATRRTVETTTK